MGWMQGLEGLEKDYQEGVEVRSKGLEGRRKRWKDGIRRRKGFLEWI